MVYVGTYGCIKKNSDPQLPYQNLDTVEIVDYKKKMILKFNYIV